MEVSPGTFEGERDRFWVGIRSKSQNALVAASGYHSPASFHKDDNRLQAGARAPQESASAADTDHAGRSGAEGAL
jgi:hypothetical protein